MADFRSNELGLEAYKKLSISVGYNNADKWILEMLDVLIIKHFHFFQQYAIF